MEPTPKPPPDDQRVALNVGSNQSAARIKSQQLQQSRRRDRQQQREAQTADKFHQIDQSALTPRAVHRQLAQFRCQHQTEHKCDQQTGQTFTEEESESLLRGFLSPRLYDAGLICRADDRGDPVIQLAPPLVAGPEEFDQYAAILRHALTDAWDQLSR